MLLLRLSFNKSSNLVLFDPHMGNKGRNTIDSSI
ncbi:hypothetical protein LINPERPRIM_LOCUS36861 [Linum perenne]